MKRIRGLPNEDYAKRKAAITRSLREHFGDCVHEPIPDDMKALLEKLK
jgi:hypothetical protein